MGKILALDDAVVQRIAAGEVVQRPCSVIKELLENSIDSHAKQIHVEINNLTKLQLRDDGCGIAREDLELLCQRHATSKIQSFGDLSRVSTFGFRGEALASVSAVSKVQVLTKTEESPVAWECSYLKNNLAGAPVRRAGTTGTVLTVLDLFYNSPGVVRTLRTPSEEYVAILEVVQKYSLYYDKVGFSCKRTGKEPDFSVGKDTTALERIRTVYGREIGAALVPVSVVDSEYTPLRARGYVSDQSFEGKRAVFVFFVNGRLVEIDLLRRSIAASYKHKALRESSPFVFLSLHLEPNTVDVNTHPTKNRVTFLYEKEVCRVIVEAIEKIAFSQQLEAPATAPRKKTGWKKTSQERRSPEPAKKIRADFRETRLEQHSQLSLSNSSPVVAKHVPSTQQTAEPVVLVPKAIVEMREQRKREADSTVQKMLFEGTFVGVVDGQYAMMQHGVSMFVFDYRKVLHEFFSDRLLFSFGNIPTASIDVLPVQHASAVTCQKKEMLRDYFGFSFSEDGVCGLPRLVEGYVPPRAKTELLFEEKFQAVDWESERSCLEHVVYETAAFYIPAEKEERDGSIFETVFFPELKKNALRTQYTEMPGVFRRVCDMDGLYRVFGRSS
ncbi:MAG: DNA mismatch repair protein Mlh1 [Amphiamblys sp. WSBS2006]|nr:MAG: DNA mismatch repair protein Mlh1 [Amphiamblys sp. WSBS2006]